MRELEIVQPEVLVVLGTVAGQSLWGTSFRVGKAQGQTCEYNGLPAVATIHPSAVLRARDSHSRQSMMDSLVADLRSAARLQKKKRPAA